MATGIQTIQDSYGDGSFIVVLDHFLRNAENKPAENEIRKTNQGLQIVLRKYIPFIVDVRLFHQKQ